MTFPIYKSWAYLRGFLVLSTVQCDTTLTSNKLTSFYLLKAILFRRRSSHTHTPLPRLHLKPAFKFNHLITSIYAYIFVLKYCLFGVFSFQKLWIKMQEIAQYFRPKRSSCLVSLLVSVFFGSSQSMPSECIVVSHLSQNCTLLAHNIQTWISNKIICWWARFPLSLKLPCPE